MSDYVCCRWLEGDCSEANCPYKHIDKFVISGTSDKGRLVPVMCDRRNSCDYAHFWRTAKLHRRAVRGRPPSAPLPIDYDI